MAAGDTGESAFATDVGFTHAKQRNTCIVKLRIMQMKYLREASSKPRVLHRRDAMREGFNELTEFSRRFVRSEHEYARGFLRESVPTKGSKLSDSRPRIRSPLLFCGIETILAHANVNDGLIVSFIGGRDPAQDFAIDTRRYGYRRVAG